MADYGLIDGETLDEEGRVIPPWVGRAERCLPPQPHHTPPHPRQSLILIMLCQICWSCRRGRSEIPSRLWLRNTWLHRGFAWQSATTSGLSLQSWYCNLVLNLSVFALQLHLKDKSAAPRRDPDLYNDVSPYVPYGGHWPGYDYNDQFGYGFAHPPVAYGGPPMPYMPAAMTAMPYPGSIPALQ